MAAAGLAGFTSTLTVGCAAVFLGSAAAGFGRAGAAAAAPGPRPGRAVVGARGLAAGALAGGTSKGMPLDEGTGDNDARGESSPDATDLKAWLKKRGARKSESVRSLLEPQSRSTLVAAD